MSGTRGTGGGGAAGGAAPGQNLLEILETRKSIRRTVPSDALTAAEQAFWLNPGLTIGQEFVCSIGTEVGQNKSQLKKALLDRDVDMGKDAISKFKKWSHGEGTPAQFLQQNVKAYCAGCFVAEYSRETCVRENDDDENDHMLYFKQEFKEGIWKIGGTLIQDILLVGKDPEGRDRILFRILPMWRTRKKRVGSNSHDVPIDYTRDFECSSVLVVYNIFSTAYLRFGKEVLWKLANQTATGTSFVTPILKNLTHTYPNLDIPSEFNEYVNKNDVGVFVNNILTKYGVDLLTNKWYASGTKMGVFIKMHSVPKAKNDAHQPSDPYIDKVREIYSTFWDVYMLYFNSDRFAFDQGSHDKMFMPPLPYTYGSIKPSATGAEGVATGSDGSVVLWVVDVAPTYKLQGLKKIVCDSNDANTKVNGFDTIPGSIIWKLRQIQITPEQEPLNQFSDMAVGNSDTIRVAPTTSVPTQPQAAQSNRAVGTVPNLRYTLHLTREQRLASDKAYQEFNHLHNALDKCGIQSVYDTNGIFTVYYDIQTYRGNITNKEGNIVGRKLMSEKVEKYVKTLQNDDGSALRYVLTNIRANITPVTDRPDLAEHMGSLFKGDLTWDGVLRNNLNASELEVFVTKVLSGVLDCNTVFFVERGRLVDEKGLQYTSDMLNEYYVSKSEYDSSRKTAFVRLNREDKKSHEWTIGLCLVHYPHGAEYSDVCETKTTYPEPLFKESTVDGLCAIFAKLDSDQKDRIEPGYSNPNRLMTLLQRAYNIMYVEVDKERESTALAYGFATDLESEPNLMDYESIRDITKGVFYLYIQGDAGDITNQKEPLSENSKAFNEAIEFRRTIGKQALGKTSNILMTDIAILADALDFNVCVKAKFKCGAIEEEYVRTLSTHPNARANVVLRFEHSGENGRQDITLGLNFDVTHPINQIRVEGYMSLYSIMEHFSPKHVLSVSFKPDKLDLPAALTSGVGASVTLSGLYTGYSVPPIVTFGLGGSASIAYLGRRVDSWLRTSLYTPSDLITDAASAESLDSLLKRKVHEKKQNKAKMVGVDEEDAVLASERKRELLHDQFNYDKKELKERHLYQMREWRKNILKATPNSLTAQFKEYMISVLKGYGFQVVAVVVGASFAIGSVLIYWDEIISHLKTNMTMYGGLALAGAVVLAIFTIYRRKSLSKDTQTYNDATGVVTKIDDELEKPLPDQVRANLKKLRRLVKQTRGQYYYVAPELKPDDIHAYVNGGKNILELEQFGYVRLNE